jgi:D-glycero-D-manno-heptose 1,7-bisphosphate phosphatase
VIIWHSILPVAATMISHAPERAAVFLDRDGVINENLEGRYVGVWSDFRLLPGAIESIAALNRAGYPVVVVTNQGGIGRGQMSETALQDIHARMHAAVEAGGARIDAVLYCPHDPQAGCDCRKPQPGLLRRAAAQLGLALGQSYFIGDHVTDVQAGLAAGCRPILVLTGRGGAVRDELAADPRYAGVPVVDDLPAAVRLILGR